MGELRIRIHFLQLIVVGFFLTINSFAQETNELHIKGAYFKVQQNSIATISSSSTETNNTDNGQLVILDNASFIAEGNINNTSSSKISIDGTLKIESDWTNNGNADLSFTSLTTGTVEFNGSSNQNIGGSISSEFENLRINNASGVTLTSDQTVQSSLSFWDGKITTGSNNLIITNTSSNITSGYGSNKFVEGTFRQYIQTDVSYKVPIGNGSDLELAELYVYNSVGLDYVDFTFTSGDEATPAGIFISGSAVTDVLNSGFWTLNPNIGFTSANYQITVSSTGHSDLGGSQDNYALLTKVGTWQNLGTYSAITQNYSTSTVKAQTNYLTVFGDYRIAYLTAPTYTPVAEADEITNNGAYIKTQNSSTLLINNTTTLNNISSGTIIIDQGTTLTAEANVYNLSSSTFKIDGVLDLKSDWINEGIASVQKTGGTYGVVSFTGSSSQSIGGTQPTIFEDILINNPSGVNLASDQEVSHDIIFSNGIITTNSNILSHSSTDNSVSGYGNTNYILGNLRRYVYPGIEYTLPLGYSSKIQNSVLYINSQTGLTFVDVAFTNTPQSVPGGLMLETTLVNSFLDNGYWTLTPNAGVTAVNYNFIATAQNHTYLGGNQENYALFANTTGSFEDIGIFSPSTQIYTASSVTAQRSYLTDFGSYVIAYFPNPSYVAPPVTNELLSKGAKLKVYDDAILTISGNSTELNNTNASTIEIKSNGTIIAEGIVNNLSLSNIKIDGSLELKSDWNNEATASLALSGSNTGTVTFSGTSNQNIGGTIPTLFENILINNNAGITLTADQNISGSITFANGIITTGANNLIHTSTTNNITGFGANKYVLGNFRKYITPSLDYDIPVGSNTSFENAQFYFHSITGVDYIDVTFTESTVSNPGGIVVEASLVEDFLDYGYWTVTPNSIIGAVNYDITCKSTSHTDLGGGQENYSLISNTGSGWQNLGTYSPSTQSYTATTVSARTNYLNSFGDYVIGYFSTPTYIAPTVIDDVTIKGTIFKVHTNTTATICNSLTTLNNTESSTIKIEEDGLLVANGDILNESLSTVKIDGILQIGGDWINNATASIAHEGLGTGLLQFTGNSNQTIGGSVATIFEDFELNKVSNVLTLTDDITISENLILTNGIIETGAYTVICTNTSAAKISGYSLTSFIYGKLRKYIATNTSSYALPLGKGTNTSDYHLAYFNNNNLTGITAIEAQVYSITESGNNVDGNIDPLKTEFGVTHLTNIHSEAIWKIEPVGTVTGGSYGMKLYVDNIPTLSSSDDFNFSVVKRSSSSTTYSDWDVFYSTTSFPINNQGGRTYVTYDAGGLPIGPGYAERNGFTTFSEIAVASSSESALPIRLLYFKATDSENTIILDWETASEINNDYFSIEKGTWNADSNKIVWKEIERINSVGNSTSNIVYSSIDTKPIVGLSYYRLKQTDFDGAFTYSNIIALEYLLKGLELECTVFPNPSLNQDIHIKNTSAFEPNSPIELVLVDILGRIKSREIIVTDIDGNFEHTINSIAEIEPGTYILRISSLLYNSKTESYYNTIIIE